MTSVEVLPQVPVAHASGCKRQLEQTSSPATPPRVRRTDAVAEAHTLRTVGDVVCRRGTVVCRTRATLGDAVDLITLHDRTSTALVDSDGKLVGELTENDIIRAFAENIEPTRGIDQWLKEQARSSSASPLDSLTVPPSTTLAEAAECLRQHASDMHFRHLIVRDEVGGLCGILSAMDLARALCGSSTDREVLRRTAQSTASEVMKHRTVLPVCSSSAPMSRALELMNSTRQNCVLVADGDIARPTNLVGIVTPRDVLRAFVEHVPASVPVGHWVRGLGSHWVPRAVVTDELVCACAAKMVRGSVHHLIVLCPATGTLAGVLSSTDLAQAVGSAERVVELCTPSDESE